MPKIQYSTKKLNADYLSVITQANLILEENQANGFNLSLRQLYYQFVSRGLIPNTEQSYKRLGNIIGDGRMAGLIDWRHITDRGRNLRSYNEWTSPGSLLRAAANQYAIDKWEGQTHRVEVWVEKDALIDVVAQACAQRSVPHFSCRGYNSASEMWEASQRLMRFRDRGQRPIIIHLGDHDPSGIDMSRDIEDRLRTFMGRAPEFHRIALNRDQVDLYDPPPNPAKVTDSRFEAYQMEHGDESWELDALPPAVLVTLIQDTINALIDDDPWYERLTKESRERGTLTAVSDRWEEVSEFLGGEVSEFLGGDEEDDDEA